MERMTIDDVFLYNLMPGLDEKLTSAMQENVDYQFTDDFEKKMETLIKRSRQKRKYGIPVTTSRRIAAILIIVLAGTFGISMGVEAVREKVFDFIETMREAYVEKQYFLREDLSEVFIPRYPEYIPNGYEIDVQEEYDNYLFMVYKETNGEGNITICQEQIEDGMMVSEDSEYIKEGDISIQNVSAQIKYKENGITRILWEKHNCMYTVSGKWINEEELIKICESLE